MAQIPDSMSQKDAMTSSLYPYEIIRPLPEMLTISGRALLAPTNAGDTDHSGRCYLSHDAPVRAVRPAKNLFSAGSIELKTRQPLILTAHIADDDLEQFDALRKMHFPSDRNCLRAHLTMFHRLPGEQLEEILPHLGRASSNISAISAVVGGLRHLCEGVAFTVDSPELQSTRSILKSAFAPWLNCQDMQKWQPHITIQNKASRAAADSLYKELGESFRPYSIKITGLELWRYLGGPWKHEALLNFSDSR